ncbi:hypothetical protein KDK95_11930 [Actinospica sp. MGRD01-02]|uniref:Uncharacterized protein n=1 Tax=Actinospica acidithermotolerans TaxID=2828514 RepID=A0A941E8I8_9ACTN|nr:hypothetical protein [Actinospica acidithermotolerans]MBR7827016.1 hypothetical protein [Actinospica acidithermotolerans]
MAEEQPQESGRTTPRLFDPLWIIALFVGLSEATVGIATTQARGWSQGLLASFAVIFPLIVFGVFFTALWRKPELLYAPGDVPEPVPTPDFVQGMHRAAPNNLKLIRSVVRQTLESVLPSALEVEVPARAINEVVRNAVAIVQADLQNQALKIDFSVVAEALGHTEVVIDNTTTVSEFLDWLWGALAYYFAPHTYGAEWVVVDRITLKAFADMGSNWAAEHGLAIDNRPLVEVGIGPGMELLVVPKVPDAVAQGGRANGANGKARATVPWPASETTHEGWLIVDHLNGS